MKDTSTRARGPPVDGLRGNVTMQQIVNRSPTKSKGKENETTMYQQ